LRNTSSTYFVSLRFSVVLGMALWLVCSLVYAQNDFDPTNLPTVKSIEIEGNESFSKETIMSLISFRSYESSLKNGIILPFYVASSISRYFNKTHDSILKKKVEDLAPPPQKLDMKLLSSNLEKLRNFYNDNGFHSAKITCKIQRDTTRNIVIPKFIIKEGPSYTLAYVLYLGLDSVDNATKEEILNTDKNDIVGKRFSSQALSQDSARIVNILRNNGYPFASGSPGTLAAVTIYEDTTNKVFIDSTTIYFSVGTRYKFAAFNENNIDIKQGKASNSLNKNVITDKRTFKDGDWFSALKLSEFELSIRSFPYISRLNIANVIDTTKKEISLKVDIELSELSLVESEFSFSPKGTDQDTRFVSDLAYDMKVNRFNLWGLGHDISGKMNLTAESRLSFTKESTLDFSTFLLGVDYNLPNNLTINLPWYKLAFERSPLSTGNKFNYTAAGVGASYNLKLNSYNWFQRADFSGEVSWKSYQDIVSFNSNEVQAMYNKLPAECAKLDTFTLTKELQDLLVENIYRQQYAQGDDKSFVTNSDIKNSFDALKWKISANISATRDKRNDVFNPTDGHIINFNAEFGILGFFKTRWLKLETDARIYQPIGKNNVFAARLHAGWIFEGGGLNLTPTSSRFFVGGASSCRGWETNNLLATLPPREKDFDPSIQDCITDIAQEIVQKSVSILGGMQVLEVSLDWRIKQLLFLPNVSTLNKQLNNLGMVFFIDAGNAFHRDYYNENLFEGTNLLDHISLSTGASLTYNSPAGALRLTGALKVYEPIYPNFNRIKNRFFTGTAIHVTLGQAF